jgi:hypothetical protein
LSFLHRSRVPRNKRPWTGVEIADENSAPDFGLEFSNRIQFDAASSR